MGQPLADLALTGLPRGGTTLACQLLGHAGNCLALFEPMPVMSLPTAPAHAVEAIRRFFDTTRAMALRERRAPSKQADGQVPDNLFTEAAADGERPSRVSEGWIPVPADLRPDFTLVIKHNAAFTAVLDELARAMPVLAIVRNPLAVLASWNSVPLPVRTGALPAGERLDPQLAASLAGAGDVPARQMRILDWFYARYANGLPHQQVFRYEDIIADQGQALCRAAGVSPGAPRPLQARNPLSRLSQSTRCELHARLHAQPGHWQHWYGADELDALLAGADDTR